MVQNARSAAVSGRRLLIGLLAVFLAAVVPAVVAPTLMCRPADPVLEDLDPVGAFQLTDERGQPFTEAAFAGQVTFVSFLFTRCDISCPVETMKMARLQEKTFDARNDIKLVSVSVDPDYDTPARLAAYAQRFQADPTRWRFVTGSAAAVRALVEGPFMNSMAADGTSPAGAPSIAHLSRFWLVDRHGKIRGKYETGDVHQLDEMIRAARYLVRVQR